jgi:hypothetical protein
MTAKLEVIFFDFVQYYSRFSKNYLITTKEPFGELLFKLSNTGSGENYDDAVLNNQKKYVYRNMYRNTQSGALQDIEKINFY